MVMVMMVTMTMIDDVSRVGKLKHRAGFLESLQGEENPVYKDQVGFFGDKNPVYKDQDGFFLENIYQSTFLESHNN